MNYKQFYTFVLRIILFTLLFSIVGRLVFLLYEHSIYAPYTLPDLWQTFFYGFTHDFSLACYIVMFVSVLTPLFAINTKVYTIATNIVLGTLFPLFTLVQIINIELYSNWHYHIDVDVFRFVDSTFSFAASTSAGTTIFLVSLWIVLSAAWLFAYFRWVQARANAKKSYSWHAAIVYILVGALFYIPARGGVDVAAMNTGSVYFSTDMKLNHAATNVVWNFIASASHPKHEKTQHKFFDQHEAERIYKAHAYTPSQPAKQLLRTQNPNIIVVMMEGFGADLSSIFSSHQGLTPCFDSLARTGVLFTNVHAASTRTDKGVVGMLSGYPAQPHMPIMNYSNKHEKIATLSGTLHERGYNTYFFYGGNKHFANMNSYLTHAKFSYIFDLQDFPQKLNTFKWGVHDEFVFDKAVTELSQATQPFFSYIMTLSHHEPFTPPTNRKFTDKPENISKIFTAAHYADSCIGNFIYKAQQEPWWDNTVIIFIADHANTQPDDKTHADITRYKIPMLWLGGAVASADIITKTCSQIDLPATLLSQLRINYADFTYSNDILDTAYSGHALFVYNDGFGVATENYYQIWDYKAHNYIANTNNTQDTLFAKALYQITFQDFLDK